MSVLGMSIGGDSARRVDTPFVRFFIGCGWDCASKICGVYRNDIFDGAGACHSGEVTLRAN